MMTKRSLVVWGIALCLGLSGCSNEDAAPTIVAEENPHIEISTSTTNAAVNTALEAAASIWEARLDLRSTIKIKVVFLPISPGFLGRAVPNGNINFVNSNQQDIWYPSALAKQLAGGDINDGANDMDILIDGTRLFYFGLDGNPSEIQYDFLTLILHEITHGLGHGTLAGIDNGLGTYSIQPNLGGYDPSFEIPDLQNLPTIYDLFIVENNVPLATQYQSPSMALAEAFTNNNLKFSGPNANQVLESIQLYAPDRFRDGTSLSHLDENTFNESENALMTPFLAEGEVLHIPSPLTLAMLKDLGWELKN